MITIVAAQIILMLDKRVKKLFLRLISNVKHVRTLASTRRNNCCAIKLQFTKTLARSMLFSLHLCNDNFFFLIFRHTCKQCEQEFSFKFLLDRHWVAVHQGYTMQCDDCGKRFSNRQTLQRHKILHTNIRDDIECPSCPALFKDRRSLKQHKALKHFGEKNFMCDVCERWFGNTCNRYLFIMFYGQTWSLGVKVN
jgi:hypothetical protein